MYTTMRTHRTNLVKASKANEQAGKIEYHTTICMRIFIRTLYGVRYTIRELFGFDVYCICIKCILWNGWSGLWEIEMVCLSLCILQFRIICCWVHASINWKLVKLLLSLLKFVFELCIVYAICIKWRMHIWLKVEVINRRAHPSRNMYIRPPPPWGFLFLQTEKKTEVQTGMRFHFSISKHYSMSLIEYSIWFWLLIIFDVPQMGRHAMLYLCIDVNIVPVRFRVWIECELWIAIKWFS